MHLYTASSDHNFPKQLRMKTKNVYYMCTPKTDVINSL